MTKLEEMTKAAYENAAVQAGRAAPGWEHLLGSHKKSMMNNMVAALKVLREPNAAMMVAADRVGIDQDPRDYFPAMVDVVLEEKP